MNVFVLNTGRCGSTTFIKACQHIGNYTAAHESRLMLTGEQRLAYPGQHIEADNRLSWMLGRLQQHYGNDAFYVHLSRDRDAVAQSFARRADYGIMKAYREGILMHETEQLSAYELALDYINTVERNIEAFLQDKPNQMKFSVESAKDDFVAFWQAINAQGDLNAALAEWDVNYNAS